MSIETKYEVEQAVSECILKYPKNTAWLPDLYSDFSKPGKQ